MVRFIMLETFWMKMFENTIYIPIWLDLLLTPDDDTHSLNSNLHSNMVRFIIWSC